MSKNDKVFKVKFYDFTKNGKCLAEVELPYTGKIVKDIQISQLSDKILCDMPVSLNGKWTFKEMKWEKVVPLIISEYLKTQHSFKSLWKIESTNVHQSSKANNANKEILEVNPKFTFGKLETKLGAFAQISFEDTTESLKDIYVQTNFNEKNREVFVTKPKIFEDADNFDIDAWEKTSEIIKNEFKRQVLNETLEKSDEFEVSFNKVGSFIVCIGDVQIYENRAPFRGFRLKMFDSGKIEVTPPSAFVEWNHPQYSWFNLRSDFSREFKKYIDSQNIEIIKAPNKYKKVKRETTYYGRIKNAEHSDFVFVPHSMLRPNTNVDETFEFKKLNSVAVALSKGQKGGIGPFEINTLWWISKLRYVTNTMLSELAAHGYISLGWRDSVKISNVTKKMGEYNMIIRSSFYCLDENGEKHDSSKSTSTIFTLAPNGSILLKELGKDVNKYNPFTVLQDGNTVKRYLVANQWLIYWLMSYKDKIGENYESAMMLQRKGEEFSVVRTYASVTIDDITMIAEPIRRVEEFEKKENENFLIDKLQRMIKILDNPNQIYSFERRIIYTKRPIIVLLCEDDEHIKSIIEVISDIMNENPKQEFWFSTDLRIFNMEHIGKRFLKMQDNELKIVEMSDYFGCDYEVEKEILIEKFLLKDVSNIN